MVIKNSVIKILISCCKTRSTLLTSAAAAAAGSSHLRLLLGDQVSTSPLSFSAGGRRVLPVWDFRNVLRDTHCEWRQSNIEETMPKFPQCNPSIRTHKALQLERGNSKQPRWECDAAERDLSFDVIFIWQHILASAYEIVRDKARLIYSIGKEKERVRQREKPRWYYLLSKHSGTSADQQSTQRSGTRTHKHSRTHSGWTSRRWTVTWQCYTQIHTKHQACLRVQSFQTWERAWHAELNEYF